jgi:succinylarginine dihydrolase
MERLGFTGPIEKVLDDLYHNHPQLLAQFYSSSSMWSANAATISPSADTRDHRVHITPANLVTHFHRYQEEKQTATILKKIFADPNYFVHHHCLPSVATFADEGAANQHRICIEYDQPGIELFVFGRYGFRHALNHDPHPKIYPARQSYDASLAISRLHQLDPSRVIFAQQHPDIIDQGVFHNDMVMLGDRNVCFVHEQAFENTKKILDTITRKFAAEHHFIQVPAKEVSIATAIETYLFNSQLVTLSNGSMVIIAPSACASNQSVKEYLEQCVASYNFLSKIVYVDCSESMRNGGGPACLRLRCVLTDDELKASHPGVFLNDSLYQQLSKWIDRHYRDSLEIEDLRDPHLIEESQCALDELTQILELGSIYSFQL